MRHFSVKEAKRALRLFVFWSVRFLIVGGRGGLLDRNYSLRAQEVGNHTIKNADELAKAMADVVPSDALFEAAFAEARVSQVFLARYLLRALELKAKGDPEPENIPNDEENAINLEHVLPDCGTRTYQHLGAQGSSRDRLSSRSWLSRLADFLIFFLRFRFT